MDVYTSPLPLAQATSVLLSNHTPTGCRVRLAVKQDKIRFTSSEFLLCGCSTSTRALERLCSLILLQLLLSAHLLSPLQDKQQAYEQEGCKNCSMLARHLSPFPRAVLIL